MVRVRTVRFGFVAVWSMAAILAVPALSAEPVVMPIQPGAGLGTGATSSCTIGYIFRDAFDWYGSTAAHCVNPGQLVTNKEACCAAFGRVVVDDDDELAGGLDFALFVVFTSKEGLINPAVRHWGGPTGVATAGTTQTGDIVMWYGTGGGFGQCYPACNTQAQPVVDAGEGGIGRFESWTGGDARYMGYALPGHSGAPVISNEDGRAVSLNAYANPHFTLPQAVGTNGGPRIESALDRMQSAYGFTLTLQTAPFTPAV